MSFQAYKITQAAKIAGKDPKNAAKQKDALFIPIYIGKPGTEEKRRFLDPYLSAVIRHTGYNGEQPESGLIICKQCGTFWAFDEKDNVCKNCKSKNIDVLFVPGSRKYEKKVAKTKKITKK